MALHSTSVESHHAHHPVHIPSEYLPAAEVFSAVKVACLPPHRLWDCAIELLPGVTPPRTCPWKKPRLWRTMWLSLMNRGLLAYPPHLPSTGFYFVKKKDGGLRPCIDYWGLNTVSLNTHTLSSWFHQRLIGSVGPSFLQSWTYEVHTT